MLIELLLIGFLSIFGQVVLLRELNVASFGIELIYILAFGFWLLWTATGALIGRRSYVPTQKSLSIIFIISAYLLPVTVVFIRGSHLLFGGVPGAYLSFITQILLIAIALFPTGILMGLLFQWAAKRYTLAGKSLAFAYGIESIGGVIGGLASTLFLKFGVQNFAIAVIFGLIALIAIIYRQLIPVPFNNNQATGKRRFTAFLTLEGVILLSFIILLFLNNVVDMKLTSLNHPSMIATKDTPYGRVTITERLGQITIFENNVLTYESQGTTAEEFVHLSLLQHPGIESVLLLGGGFEGIVSEILKHNPLKITYVELNKSLLSSVMEFLPQDIESGLNSNKVRLIHDDPRRFLEKLEEYDVILVGMPDPLSLQANRYYTQEFFKLCKSRMSTDGILAFRLKSSENYWTPQLTLRIGSIYKALKSEFEDVVVLPGATNVMIASNTMMVRDPDILSDRLHKRSIQARLVTEPFLHYIYANDRFVNVISKLEEIQTVTNSDLNPACYRHALIVWLSKFFPGMAYIEIESLQEKIKKILPFSIPLFLLIIGVLIWIRRFKSIRLAVLVGFAGFAGMVLETVLVMFYQVKNGVLYQDLGILLMLFMGGLAVGAISVDRLIKLNKFQLRIAGGILGLLIMQCIYIIIRFRSGGCGTLFEIGCMLLLSGVITSGLFAFSTKVHPRKQNEIISPLYAADLLGGCLGSLICSLILLPIFGLGNSLMILVVISVIVLLLI
ncbi:MAG: hypothetical protein P9L92_19550 [Candidatus Electryonea clarkiae]|nr:hypothetical protein [Candidatus Electryonea clarkiae]MDP8288996.1 hypothetical protein [Candidatus Electryonea clarkiae]